MTTRTKATRTASSDVQDTPKLHLLLQKDDWIDALDSEGVWNVARVLSIPSSEEVEIHYDNWPNEFNEIIHFSENRIAPFHTFTWSVKCWVKYDNWPWWPALATIRTAGTATGVDYLRQEKRLSIDPLDSRSLKRRQRGWLELKQVSPLQEDFEDKKAESTGKDFDLSFLTMEKSTADEEFPELDGTLPKKTKFNPPIMTVAEMKKKLGPTWIQRFLDNRKRFDEIFLSSHKTAISRKTKAVSSSNVADMPLALQKNRSTCQKAIAKRIVPERIKEKTRRNREASLKMIDTSISVGPESIEKADDIHRKSCSEYKEQKLRKRKKSGIARDLVLKIDDSSIKPSRRQAAVRAESIIAPTQTSLFSPSEDGSSEQEFEYGVAKAQRTTEMAPLNKAHVIENIDSVEIEFDRNGVHRAKDTSPEISQPKPKRRLPVVAAKSSSSAAKPLPTRMKSLPAKIANPELYENIVEAYSAVSRAEPKSTLSPKVARLKDAMLSSIEDQPYRPGGDEWFSNTSSVVNNQQIPRHEEDVSSDEIDEWDEARNSSYLQTNYVPFVRAQRSASPKSNNNNTFVKYHSRAPSENLENDIEMEEVGNNVLSSDYYEVEDNQQQECEAVARSSWAAEELQNAEIYTNDMDHLKSRIFDSPPWKYDDPEVWDHRMKVDVQPLDTPPQHSFLSTYVIARDDTAPLRCLNSHMSTLSNTCATITTAEPKLLSNSTTTVGSKDLNRSINSSYHTVGNPIPCQITSKTPHVVGSIVTELETENPKSQSPNAASLDSNKKDCENILMVNMESNKKAAKEGGQADAIDDKTSISDVNQLTEYTDSNNIKNSAKLRTELTRTVNDVVMDDMLNADSSIAPSVATSTTTKAVSRFLHISSILNDPVKDANDLIEVNPVNEMSRSFIERSSSFQMESPEEKLPTKKQTAPQVSKSDIHHVTEKDNGTASDNQQHGILTSTITADIEYNVDAVAIALSSNSAVVSDNQMEIDNVLTQVLQGIEDISRHSISENKGIDEALTEEDHQDVPVTKVPSFITENSVAIKEVRAEDKNPNEVSLLSFGQDSIEETPNIPVTESKADTTDEAINILVEESSSCVDESPIAHSGDGVSVGQSNLVVNQREDFDQTNRTLKQNEATGRMRSKLRRSRNVKSARSGRKQKKNPRTNMGSSRPYVFMMHTDNRSLVYNCLEIEEPIKVDITPRSLTPRVVIPNQDLGRISNEETVQSTEFSIEKWFIQNISSSIIP